MGQNEREEQYGMQGAQQSWALLTRVDHIRSRIIKRYYQLERAVRDGPIDPVDAFLVHLYCQDIAPQLDAIAQEAMRL